MGRKQRDEERGKILEKNKERNRLVEKEAVRGSSTLPKLMPFPGGRKDVFKF